MLVKKELLAISPLPKPKGKWKLKFVPAAQIVELPRSGRILSVDYYQDKEVYARFFCDGQNYTVYSPGKNVFGSGYPTPGGRGYYSNDVASVVETDAVCNKFFDGRRGVEETNAFIYRKGLQKRESACRSISDLMKQHMGMFPPYPQNLRSYCEENVFQKHYVFFGKKEKDGTRTAKCSHCGSEFKISEHIISGKDIDCPSCHTKAISRATWAKSDVVDKADICISYKVENQLLLRWAHVQRTYRWPEFSVDIDFDDFAYSLYLVVKGTPKIYTYKYFRAPYSWSAEWHRLPIGSTCTSSSFIYTDNLEEVFGESYYNVNLKKGLEGKHLKLQFVELLDNLKGCEKAEYLFKMGLPMLAESASSVRGNPDGEGVFQKQVGISKQYLPMLRSMNVTLSELRIIKKAQEWVSPDLLQRYRNLSSKMSAYLSFEEMIEAGGLSRALNYLDKQKKIYPKEPLSRIVTEYQDYIRMSKELHVDMSHKSVLYPADIIDAHRITTQRYNAVQHELRMEREQRLDSDFAVRANQLYSEMGLTDFQKDGFCIVLPQKRTDLIAEGHSLNHCVGSERYYTNHLEGRYMIFFIRKINSVDKPYFTMEMDVLTWKIKQLYGFGDCSAPKEVRAFANAFAQFMHNKKARKTA